MTLTRGAAPATAATLLRTAATMPATCVPWPLSPDSGRTLASGWHMGRSCVAYLARAVRAVRAEVCTRLLALAVFRAGGGGLDGGGGEGGGGEGGEGGGGGDTRARQSPWHASPEPAKSNPLMSST